MSVTDSGKPRKKRLLTLKEGDIYLNRFSPTGFYSSAVSNAFLEELVGRTTRQVSYTLEVGGDHDTPFASGARRRTVFLTSQDHKRVQEWVSQGYEMALRTPDSTLIFVTPEKAAAIHADQVNCMGCLSACLFSNWSQGGHGTPPGTTGKKADPRSFCIQKTLQEISHNDDVDNQLMFAGHNAYRFALDPFYKDGFIPTLRQLAAQIQTGD